MCSASQDASEGCREEGEFALAKAKPGCSPERVEDATDCPRCCSNQRPDGDAHGKGVTPAVDRPVMRNEVIGSLTIDDDLGKSEGGERYVLR